MSQHGFLTQRRLNYEIFFSFFLHFQSTLLIKKTLQVNKKKNQTSKLTRPKFFATSWTVRVGLQNSSCESFLLNFIHSISNIFYEVSTIKIENNHIRIRHRKTINFLTSFIACIRRLHSILPHTYLPYI